MRVAQRCSSSHDTCVMRSLKLGPKVKGPALTRSNVIPGSQKNASQTRLPIDRMTLDSCEAIYKWVQRRGRRVHYITDDCSRILQPPIRCPFVATV